MRNITKQIKKAISVNATWCISDFFYFIEMLKNNGFETSFWEGEENWAELLLNRGVVGYVWQKYPLIIIDERCTAEIKGSIDELKYIVVLESKDLTRQEFTIDTDEEITSRIGYRLDTKNFSANDFWFYTIG
ncbi:hypothetical protein MgSA37_04356 [Mucilaginibacter gotjawali]|nr:hypothetical protein MgSA37_04356 [Mucilaginibacter gotjawali]